MGLYRMGKVYVAFQFDTEDFVTPETDDVLLDLIKILDHFGVKGSFCIVGEKLRALERRGRSDVLEALKRHDIAYQSDLHSVHPVISEYLRDKGWDEGVEEVKRRESPGIKLIEEIFDVKPSAFIQPGGSWAPQTPYASMLMEVPTYVDGIFQDYPVWFCGALCFKAALGFPEDSTLDDLDALKSRFEEVYRSKVKGGLITIVMHPCKFVTEEFWDAVNFSHGRNPPMDRVMPAPLRDEKSVEESLQVFQKFLGFILEHPNVKAVSFREVMDLYREPSERRLRLEEIFELARKASNCNDWQVIDGVPVSPAEMLRLFIDVIVDYLQEGFEPRSVPIHFTLGPTSKPEEKRISGNISMKDLLEMLCYAKNFIDNHGRLPSKASIGKTYAGPSDLLEAAAKTISYYSLHGGLPESVEICGLPEHPEVVERWNLTERVNRQWRWIIFPEEFRSERIEELTLLQSWTIKPAVLKDE